MRREYCHPDFRNIGVAARGPVRVSVGNPQCVAFERFKGGLLRQEHVAKRHVGRVDAPNASALALGAQLFDILHAAMPNPVSLSAFTADDVKIPMILVLAAL